MTFMQSLIRLQGLEKSTKLITVGPTSIPDSRVKDILTDRGTYPQLPTQPKKIVQVQTNTVVFYGHPELFGEEKSKFELGGKKFSIVLKMEIC